ncbi:hypothetical protein [Microbispora sp. GKU 823]|uniref:hypothetical protein n=1 Tax=Microbispora sp. GKU 823 TaxID=1652100 RepID=UPI0009A4457C|nr:hypothetical protein [Microbispora sp. GKU 823]OPG05712.1 hypothetical protein B1L11_34560 [Microbispora sp. GKU 823]
MMLADVHPGYLWLVAGLSTLFALVRLGLLMPSWGYRMRASLGFLVVFGGLVAVMAFDSRPDSSEARGLTIYAATMIALFAATIGQGEEIREAAAHALQNPDGETRQVRPGPFTVKFLLVLGAEILLLSLVFPDF